MAIFVIEVQFKPAIIDFQDALFSSGQFVSPLSTKIIGIYNGSCCKAGASILVANIIDCLAFRPKSVSSVQRDGVISHKGG